MAVTVTMDIINSLVRTVGLVIGGLWVAWTFHNLQRTRAAEAGIQGELAKTEKTLAERVGLERRHLSQQPNLEIEFSEIIEHHAPDVAQAYLAVAIDLRNTGSLNLKLLFSKAALTVGHFDLRDKQLKLMSDVQRAKPGFFSEEGHRIYDVPYRIFRAGQRRQMAFLVPIQDSGLYLIEFAAIYRKFPFEGEEDIDEAEPVSINAWQQRVVAVGLDRSKVLMNNRAAGSSNTD